MDERRPKTTKAAAFLPMGIAIGVALGVAIGTAMDNLAIGVAIGISLGMAFGGAFTAVSAARKGSDGDPATPNEDREASGSGLDSGADDGGGGD